MVHIRIEIRSFGSNPLMFIYIYTNSIIIHFNGINELCKHLLLVGLLDKLQNQRARLLDKLQNQRAALLDKLQNQRAVLLDKLQNQRAVLLDKFQNPSAVLVV